MNRIAIHCFVNVFPLINRIAIERNFSSIKSHYLPIQGTAMGTRMAPRTGPNLRQTSCTERLTKDWWRYIHVNDNFTICPHGEEKLRCFLDYINSSHPTIKFKAQWSRDCHILTYHSDTDGWQWVTEIETTQNLCQTWRQWKTNWGTKNISGQRL